MLQSECQTHQYAISYREYLRWSLVFPFIFTLLGGCVTGGRAWATGDQGEDLHSEHRDPGSTDTLL